MPQSVRSAPLLIRRALLLAGAAGAAGLVALQSMAPAAALVRSPRSHPAVTAKARPAVTAGTRNSALTVTGPRMYDPKTNSLFPQHSTVTVSQATGLVNQTIHVSWTNFTPSQPQTPYQNTLTEYPVMVAQCPGDSPGHSPAALSRCNVGTIGLPLTNAPYGGPSNEAYNITTKNGTGGVDIGIQTSLQNQALGCDARHDCSLLILPAEGGYPGGQGGVGAKCSDHSADGFSFGVPGWAAAVNTFDVPDFGSSGGDTCAWAYRIVIPLHFAKTPANCGFSQPDFSVEGSPFMERGMLSWESALCHGSSPLDVAYSGSISEPQARTDFLSGLSDVALTTQPASGPGKHPYTYAPVGISAAVFAYWLDNAKTSQPYPSGMKLDPRLMAKEVTQSYTYGTACNPQGQPQPIIDSGCDPNVMGDRTDLLTDPEFRALNPGLKNLPDEGHPRMVPTVDGSESDMTWEVTRWIAADKTASQFMAGQFDPWGTHLNTSYLGSTQYPTPQFVKHDETGAASYSFTPVQPADAVSVYQSENWWPGVDWTTKVPNACGTPGQPQCTHPAQPVELLGFRTLAAITDNADAAAFQFPVAALENHAGKYVTPTQASMAAAVKDMTTSGNGITKDANEAASSPDAYPLTMVSYAMVPTGGLSHRKAVKIARWLDFVAGRGQKQGLVLGELPPGYLPLPASMRKQTRKAAFEVLHQTGDHGGQGGGPGGGNSGKSGNSGNSGSGGSGGTSGTGSAGNGAGGAGGSGSSSNPNGQSAISAAFSNPDTQGFARLIVPILLIVGALLALAGPSTVVLSRPGGRAALARGWQRVQAPLHHLPFGLGRKS
jgi:hypothetical protein